MSTAPLVTVLVAVHDGEPFLRLAIESVLRQTVSDIELLVVDDASTDGTAATLAAVDDGRLRVLRNEEQLGLASSLNRGLDDARGSVVARMDADDIALRNWIERCLGLLRSSSGVGIVGAGVLDIDADGRPGSVHVHDSGSAAFRWRALFSSPAFHNTVVLDRDVLERHGLRYDAAFGESEDYELWTRLLRVTEGDSLDVPLVLHRLHPGQASRRRGDLQRSLAHDISLRQIVELAPGLEREQAALARAIAIGRRIPPGEVAEAVDAFLDLLQEFVKKGGYPDSELEIVRRGAARSLVRASFQAGGGGRARIARRAAALDPALPAHAAARRASRLKLRRTVGRDAVRLVRALNSGAGEVPIRVVAVFPEPTPYRSPLLDRIASLPEIDLTVVYAADTVARRTWQVEPRHRAVFLRGFRVPGAVKILHHDYPVTPGIRRALGDARPDVVVVSGWSTFAAKAAIAWCRVNAVPYLLVVESHDEGPRTGWRRAVKGTVVPPIVRQASGILATGTLARSSMIARGAPPERVRVFANTVDVEAFGDRADELAPMRPELRRQLGADAHDVVVLSVARLVPEKRLDVLVQAVAATDDPRLLLVLAGDGPQGEELEQLVQATGVRTAFVGDVEWERIVELYAAADVFALVSEREPWAVVVNEAAACGLPLVLSDRVGAAHDLLRDGENGVLVSAGDIDGIAVALRDLAADGDRRRAMGSRSRELARDWGYGPSVDGFLAAVREAVADRR